MNSPVITNSPNAPRVTVGDRVVIVTGNPSRDLTGYVESIDAKAQTGKMVYGPTFPLSSVVKFMQRNGAPIPKGTACLPVNGY